MSVIPARENQRARQMCVELMQGIDLVADVRRFDPIDGVNAEYTIGQYGDLNVFYPGLDPIHEVTINQSDWRIVSFVPVTELKAVS